MVFHFMRHGQTDHNKDGILQGHLDTALNERGKAQVFEAVKTLRAHEFDLVIASPLKRAYETGRIVAQEIDAPLQVNPHLRERTFGELDGMSFAQIRTLHPDFWEIIRRDDGRVTPGCETLEEVEHRLRAFIEELRPLGQSKKILVVSHGATGRILHKLINRDEAFHEFEIENCKIIEFELD
ncbi:MAG: hypothetical protein AVO33_06810 [delta proteobacterium ML8_F1]|nr:MAG: hypothetical protein AVO33_06810 [delta proteobacterium ML8_F1]